MENLLTILAFVAFVIISMKADKKKNAAKKQPGTPTPPQPTARQTTPRPAKPVTAPRPVAQPFPPLRTQQKTEKVKAPKPQKAATPVMNDAQAVSHIHPPVSTPESTHPPIPSVSPPAPDYGIHSDEDLKRAVIWSEILNRKY